MNGLYASISGLISNLKKTARMGFFPQGDRRRVESRVEGNKKSGKTRKGATHKQGKVFRSKMRTRVSSYLLNPDAPKSAYVFVTPAQYRRLHLGVTKKKKQGV